MASAQVAFAVGLGLGLLAGWYFRTSYQRHLFNTLTRIQRKMRGQSRKRRRR